MLTLAHVVRATHLAPGELLEFPEVLEHLHGILVDEQRAARKAERRARRRRGR